MRRAEGRGQRAGSRAKVLALCPLLFALSACSPAPPPKPTARNLVLITIDTLRADRVGVYGWTRARTPVLDALAREGAVFERAYAAAPITLPSHATILTGRYPPGHGARDNGLRVSESAPTLATQLRASGFKTAAFVAAFPLDHQFGLARGFDVYGDRMPRGSDGRLANERPASQVVDEAIGWLSTLNVTPSTQHPFFLWVHLFEPHAPYGDPGSGRSTSDRYDDEIATADREIGRLLAALAPVRSQTLVVAAGDHGEAFGEHGEFAHSIFVYDTTLRVPLLMSGPGIRAATRIADPVTLADLAPTAMRALGATMTDVDGVDLAPALAGTSLAPRELYAESFAPLVEFGWAPLRALRSGPWKYIAAPKAELYDVGKDAGEQSNLVAAESTIARGLDQRVARYSPASPPSVAGMSPDAAERLRTLGYTAGSQSAGSQSALRNPQSALSGLADPKDRRDMAARLALVTSGELTGAALLAALDGLVRDDPKNGQAHLRLAYARLEAGDCAKAEPEFRAAIASGLPGADAHLGLASCQGRRKDLAGAEESLAEARRREPDNPVVAANIGILQAARGELSAAAASLEAALAADPGLDEARFNLAIVYAKLNKRSEAAAAARELLRRLPPNAPQRPEVERLLKAVQ
jgi:choline-sulfatase